jgi:hypothetical protein
MSCTLVIMFYFAFVRFSKWRIEKSWFHLSTTGDRASATKTPIQIKQMKTFLWSFVRSQVQGKIKAKGDPGYHRNRALSSTNNASKLPLGKNGNVEDNGWRNVQTSVLLMGFEHDVKRFLHIHKEEISARNEGLKKQTYKNYSEKCLFPTQVVTHGLFLNWTRSSEVRSWRLWIISYRTAVVTNWSWVLLETPPVAQLLENFAKFYGNLSFISVHKILPLASILTQINSVSHPIISQIPFNIILLSTSRSS